MSHVILVDHHDQPIGRCDKLLAHQQGLLHRAFSIFVFRRRVGILELLLQQRAATKYHSAGLWSNTCCSHPQAGETTIAAAQRRLEEEFGFTLPLNMIGHFIYHVELNDGLTEYEFDHVLIGMYDNETIQPDPTEIQAYQWVNAQELISLIDRNPGQYSAWLREAAMIATHSLELNFPS